jgi:hypothetical protein
MTDDKRMASAAKAAVYYRNYRRARDRALIKLSHLHPEDYKELLEKEKVSDEPRIVAREKSRGITLTQTDSGTNQGNNGGEA